MDTRYPEIRPEHRLNNLFGISPALQSLFDTQQGPQAAPQAPSPVSPHQAGSSGFRGVLDRIYKGGGDALGNIFGGQDDPRLSEEQNKKARRQAMLQAGLATLAGSQQSGATGLGSIAQGAMYGQEAGAAGRENIYAMTQAERVQNALQDPAIVGNLTPEQRAMIRLMPPGEAAKALSELAFRKPELTNVPQGNTVLKDGEVMFTNPAKPDALPADARIALMGLGIDPAELDSLSPEDRGAFIKAIMDLRRSGSTSITTNLGPVASPAQSAFGADVADGFKKVPEILGSLPRIQQAINITEDPEIQSLLGKGIFKSGNDILERAKGNTKGLAMAQAFDVLTGEEGLRILTAFTGPKTENENRIAWKLASADRSLSGEEIRAGMNVMRRSQLFNAKQWADMVESSGPSIVGNDPTVWAEYRKRVASVNAEWDKELARMLALGLDISGYAR